MEKQYDVCLSFAGEQRNYVKKVYDELVKNHIRVFYDQDKDIETYLWGKNLYEAFKEIYKTKALYCIMFVSKEYAQKHGHGMKNVALFLGLIRRVKSIYCPYVLIVLKFLD